MKGIHQSRTNGECSFCHYFACPIFFVWTRVVCSLSYYSNTEAVLFACFLSGPPQWVDCLVPRWEVVLSVFCKDTATCYRIGSRIKVSKLFDY